MSVIRIGLKYCGGCNPSYDRVEYLQEVQEAAGNRFEWVPAADGGFTTVLLICGCDKRCAEMPEYEESGHRVITVKDGDKVPTEIISLILQEGDTP